MSVRQREQALKRKQQDPFRPAVVGDASGNYLGVRPGRVLIREQYGNGTYGPPIEVWGPEVPLVLYAGLSITLGQNAKRQLYVKGVNQAGTLAQGTNPLSITQYANMAASTNQAALSTLKLVPKTGLILSLLGWNPVVSGVYYELQFPDIDLTAYVPATGEMCFAVVGVLADLSAVEIQTSTARSSSDLPLDADDVNEALALFSAGVDPVLAVKLVGDQTTITQADLDVDGRDLRQVVNTNRVYAFTPSGTADTAGLTGDIAYDDSYLYVKVSAGWKRASLGTF